MFSPSSYPIPSAGVLPPSYSQTMMEDQDFSVNLMPPPLPPRKRNKDSTSSCPPLTGARHPPELPPRAPPVPPRRDSLCSTLPRSNSLSQHLRSVSSSHLSATLPRCNTVEKDSSRPALSNAFDMSSDSNLAVSSQSQTPTPRLPPRTYRIAHARQQSS